MVKKVIIAMSGGVDSSVAAALLEKEGFEVVGFFLKLWPSFSERGARLVAKKLGINFYVLDLQKEFKKKVVDYFIREYKLGLTPNPCVVCNKEIKFKVLFRELVELKADYIATGHYVRVIDDSRQRPFRLYKGRDKNKDQSYFLWKLNQKTLKKALFPIGDYTKSEVRKLAEKFKLPVANVPESKEICFIQKSLNDFLKKHLKLKPGPIIEKLKTGHEKIIGRHRGLWFYTIGQRKGLGLPGWPFYVVAKNLKKNVLFVSKNEKDLLKKETLVKSLNWISGKEPKLPLKIKVKIRYQQKEVPAFLKKEKNNKIKIIFSQAQRAVTPGQSAVFYQGREVLGGGIIDYSFCLK